VAVCSTVVNYNGLDSWLFLKSILGHSGAPTTGRIQQLAYDAKQKQGATKLLLKLLTNDGFWEWRKLFDLNDSAIFDSKWKQCYSHSTVGVFLCRLSTGYWEIHRSCSQLYSVRFWQLQLSWAGSRAWCHRLSLCSTYSSRFILLLFCFHNVITWNGVLANLTGTVSGFWPIVLLHGVIWSYTCTVWSASSSWWRTPNRALPYWRPDAKYLSPLPSSMPCGPRNSVTVDPLQSFSAKWFLDDRRVSSSQMVDVVRQRWHDGGLPQDSTGPGARRTSAGRTWPFQRLASSL